MNPSLFKRLPRFGKPSVSNIFETRYGSEKTVGPQALGPFLDAAACVPTEALDFKAQESRGRPIDFSLMIFNSFHRLSRRLSPTGSYILAFHNLVGSVVPTDRGRLRITAPTGSLKVQASVGATIRGRPIDFRSMNFGSFHRLSRRLSPTSSYLFTFHNLVGSVVPTDRGRLGTTAPT